MPRVVDEAESVLIDSGIPIYTRAGTLMQPVSEVISLADGRVTHKARLRPLTPVALDDILARHARFQRFDSRLQSWVNANPPDKMSATLLAREGRWRLSPISGIVTTPTLRPDGSLLTAPGYDPATRLYLMLDEDVVLPDIPDRPGRDEAEAALRLLSDLLTEFPFVGPVDRAVALSAILTAVVRPSLGAAPAHGIRASTAGTGKSFLVDLFAAIATGRPCAVMAVGKTEEETEKRLGALLLDGSPVISLDNVNGELGGDTLCQITERPLVRVRILGRSEAPEIECRATVFATGNNLTFMGDMTRRAVLCTLDAGVERPEQREFAGDPLRAILANRGAYIAAAIIIVRAYRTAGAPRVCGPIGSYGAWSDSVRSALIWLGEADPVASMDVMRDEDPERAALSELIAAWEEHLAPHSYYTTSQLERAAVETAYEGEFLRPSLREVLLRYARQGNVISTRSLGRWLTRIRGRVVNGWRIEMIADDKRGNRYALGRPPEEDP
ncbi:hypothetical protein ACQVP2_22400 [Methylobacterium aquaticum]|uniref:hypothetical protein n=1 Tax=Methylobacterium aquaticum TaxID=270351 RepID=UPI003D18573B